MGALAPLFAAAAPAAIAGGTSLLSSLIGGDEDSGPKVTATNPAFADLNRIFGTVFRSGRDGGVFDDPSSPGVFGPRLDESISRFAFDPIDLFGGERATVEGFLQGQEPLADITRATGQLDELIGTNQNLLDTGFQVSARPFFDEAIRTLEERVVPMIAERVGTQVGTASTAFGDEVARAGRDLLGQAALQDVGLAESAAQRRAGAIPLQNTLINTRLGQRSSFANDLLSLGTGLRNVQESFRSRPLQVFSALSGLGAPSRQGFLVSGQNPQGSGTADLLSAAAQAIPPFLNSGGFGSFKGGLSSIVGAFGGPNPFAIPSGFQV